MARGASLGVDMGLLGDFEDPKTQGLLSLGLGLLNSRGNFGQGLGQAGMQAMDVMRQAKQDQQRSEAMKQQQAMQAIQMQAAQQQLADQQRAAAQAQRQQEFLQNLPSPQMQANGQAMAGGGGPTAANAARVPAVDPMQQMMFGAVKSGALPLSSYIASMQKDETPMALAEGGKLVTRAGKVLAENPKTHEQPSAVREYEYARQQGFGGSFQDFVIQQKKAGATNVSMSMDKGFGDAFAKDAAGALATSRDQARAAVNTIQTIDRINQTLDTGKVAIGPTSKFETFGRQLGETIGVGGKGNAEVLANTRKVIQGAAALAVDGAAALKGQGQITEGERVLVSRAAGGDVDSLTAPEIRSLTGVLRKINGQRIASHQQQLGNVGKQFQPFVPFYQVDMPNEPTSIDSLVDKYTKPGR